MRAQVPVRAARNPFDLTPPHWELVFDVIVALGIMRWLFLVDVIGVRTDDSGFIAANHLDPDVFSPDVEGLLPPREPRVAPVVMPSIFRPRFDEKFHLHLLELAVA